MSNLPVPVELSAAREQFLALVGELRPDLHRYCARLVGSAIDGEDVVQEALAKAFYALGLQPELPPLKPWLFRIAHNTAIDFLRRYERRFVEPMADLPDTALADAGADPEVIRAALSTFVALPVSQRSAVILKDVLAHSLEEIAAATGATVPAIKAALVRGRANLRARAQPDFTAWRDRAGTSPEERALLARYVSLFNARDWEGVKAMLLEECRLDLVSKSARQGKEVGYYFGRYAQERDLRFVLGVAEGRDVVGVFRGDASRPDYVILVEFDGDHVSLIRDYRYIPYVAAELQFEPQQASMRVPKPTE
ncbi:MAG: polymerase, sigma-24 subunit, subfamily [Myxococcales bacterium]|nr:polymerase, sigma-24 subunit, subfamily [Myxococcales bacterium]